MDFFAAAAFTCAHMCLSLLLTFSLQNEETGSGATLFRRRSSIWKVLRGIWTDAHRCLLKNASLIVSRTFNGIDEIIGGFIAKVDRPKALKIKLNLSMPKRTPKRRSPNIGERKLKWAILVSWPLSSCKCIKICESRRMLGPCQIVSDQAGFLDTSCALQIGAFIHLSRTRNLSLEISYACYLIVDILWNQQNHTCQTERIPY